MTKQHFKGNVLNGKMAVFGGVLLSYMDIAGASAARDICPSRIVTVAFKEVIFKKPVFVGDDLEFYAEVYEIGRTSIKTHVAVHATRDGQVLHVTDGEAIFVAVDDSGTPIKVVGANGRKPRIRRKKPTQVCEHAETSCSIGNGSSCTNSGSEIVISVGTKSGAPIEPNK